MYENNHYVPQFILRRFGEKINRYNVQTYEFKCKGSTINAFSKKNLYPAWLEKMFCDIEARMANLIDNKILKATSEVVLTRKENWLIKKFFTIATLRVTDSILFSVKHLDSEEKLKNMGFKEVKIEGESKLEYAYRTMKVILEANNIKEVYNHPQITYEACKWSTLYQNCDLSIWDSEKVKEDFIITDNGMNCEHDKSRFVTFPNLCEQGFYKNEIDEMLKEGYVLRHLFEETNNLKKQIYAKIWEKMKYVHANYYLFAVSGRRTISLINPFFRLFFDDNKLKIIGKEPDVWPTLLSKEAMTANTCTYEQSDTSNEGNDLFHYKIKDLSLEEVITINCMMLDRVYNWVGFDDSNRISRSLNVYSLIPKEQQRNFYDELIKILFGLGCEFPKTKKYIEMSQRLTTKAFTYKEMDYIKFYFKLIRQNNKNIV